ncbi:hypothetical protein IO90_16865 [Chryseobacterium sp. FH1]|nr:hypothetical protein IO90_16865 [Chryseobacterium sp. FH1]
MKTYTAVLPFLVLFLYGQKPISKFTGNYCSSESSNVFGFVNESTNDPTNYFWEFVGGLSATSTIENPVVTYPSSRTYVAKLIVGNANGSSTSTRTIKIASSASPRFF